MQFSDERWLTVSANSRHGKVHFTVEDTGVGIAQENIPKVFDPFFSTKDSEGVARGLGLNVARRVVEEMHGRMRIDSTQTETSSGTVVEMEWPLPEAAISDAEFEQATIDAAKAKPDLIIEEKPVDEETADLILSDLDLLADEYTPTSPEFPIVPIRKPIVRTMD
jgi:hypothetical protein